MVGRRRATKTIQSVARETLRRLRGEEFVSLEGIVRATGTSRGTVKRAFDYLRDQGADMQYVEAARAWRLNDKSFALPLIDPAIEDLQAALTAAGLLDGLGQARASERAWSLFKELEVRLHGGRGQAIRQDALRVTQSVSRVRDPAWVMRLLRAARRHVVELVYFSPWKNERSSHVFEPWQVWLHGGNFYVRGYSRTRRAPRTFRLASVERLDVRVGEKPKARVPEDAAVWSGTDPRLGVDDDRPGEAVVRFRGGVARWVERAVWHPRQTDTWVSDGELLERRVPFRSCREFARMLVGFGDGIESIEPPDLRREVVAIARGAARAK